MTAPFLLEANKLKNIQFYLEKNDNLLNIISKYGCELNLLDQFVDLEKGRKSDVDKLNAELKNIWQQLRSKKKLFQEGNVNNLDLRSFKQEMIELQETILNLKTVLFNNIEKLKDEEKSMWEMTELFNQKLIEWDKAVKISNCHSYAAPKNTTNRNVHYKEVLEFLDFVNKNKGHENGWSSEDHQLFLNLRRKYKNLDQLAVNLNKLLPDISIDDVKQHEAWFRHYTLLKNKKNEALEKWRNEKKENTFQNFEKNSPPTKNRVSPKRRDDDIYEKIALWKAEKEAKRQQQYVCEQMKIKKMKRLEENKKKFDYQVKQEVLKWRESKIEKEQNEAVRKELEEYYEKKLRAATANKLIKQFQTQDDYFIARMRSKKLKEENETEKRSKSSYLMHRDPERILKPTKQWLLRTTKDSFVDDAPTLYVPNIREIPKLKIPEWRRNS